MQSQAQIRARVKFLRNAFNLSPQEWDTVLAFQNGVCFVCGKHSVGKRLSTDHSHDTGLFRGLLCSRCNPLLGKLENAFKRYGLHKIDGLTVVHVLSRLLLYLNSPPATQALGREVFGYPGKIGTAKYRKWVMKNSRSNTNR